MIYSRRISISIVSRNDRHIGEEHPRVGHNCIADLRDRAGVTPLRDRAGVTPLRHKAGVTPLRDRAGVTPLRHRAGVTPLRDRAGVTPLRDRAGITPLHPDACHCSYCLLLQCLALPHHVWVYIHTQLGRVIQISFVFERPIHIDVSKLRMIALTAVFMLISVKVFLH